MEIGKAAVAILERVDAHKPQVCDCGAYHRTSFCLPVEPIQEYFHFFLYTIRSRSNIVNPFASHHPGNNVLLVGAILANFDLRPLAIS